MIPFGGDDDGFRPNRSILKSVGGTHLTSPLRHFAADCALSNERGGGRFVRRDTLRKEWNRLRGHLGCNKIVQKSTLAPIQEALIRQFLTVETHYIVHKQFYSCVEAAIMNTDLQGKALDKQYRTSHSVRWCMKKLEAAMKNDRRLIKYYQAKELLERGVLLTAVRRYKKNPHKVSPDSITSLWRQVDENTYKLCVGNVILWASSSFLVVEDKTGVQHLMSRDHLLALQDVLSQRFMMQLATKCARSWGLHNHVTETILNRAFVWGDKILTMYGEEGYKLLSQWEPICLAVLLGSKDDPVVEQKFPNQMYQDFLDTFPNDPDVMEHLGEMKSIITSAIEINHEAWCQMYGLYRVWGHPTIDPIEGIRKLKSYACKQRYTSSHAISKVSSYFKQQFCINYRIRHGRWPALDISRLPICNKVAQAIRENTMLQFDKSEEGLGTWSLIKAQKTFEVKLTYDLADLISDSAMSHNFTQLKESAAKGSIGRSEDRAVIVQWLKSNLSDPNEFLSRIDREGFDHEERVIGVYPKEREMKVFARFFGLLPLGKRMYVVLTEAMIADHILPYFPEVTMMDTSSKLTKRKYNSTKGQKEGSSRWIHIVTSMDFEKWNSNMRKRETLEIFGFLDNLFGYENVFSRTHEMFENSTLYLCDGTYLPRFSGDEMITGPEAWRGHLGGIEGLRQKGWTLFTVCMINMVAKEFGNSFELIGQGDNQVLRTTWDTATLPKSQIKIQHNLMIERLCELMSEIGPPLKASETWSSSTFFIYGKDCYYQGKNLSMSLKRLCRMFKTDNDGLPTLESVISSVSANASAATQVDHSPVLALFVASFESAGAFLLHLLENPLKGGGELIDFDKRDCSFRVAGADGKHETTAFRINGDFIRALKRREARALVPLMVWPKTLGGYPVIHLSHLISKGFPDRLTLDISMLKAIYQLTRDNLVRIILGRLLYVHLNKVRNNLLLIQDPYSVNLLTPSSPKERVQSLVSSYLQKADWIDNPMFRTFLPLATTRQEPLCKYLMTMEPMNPRVAHEVFESTLEGRAMRVIKKVNKTSTILKLAGAASQRSFLDQVSEAESNYFAHLLYSISFPGTHQLEDTVCSSTLAQALRVASWGLEITGVTVASPLEAFQIVEVTLEGCRVCNGEKPNGYILVRLEDDVLQVSDLYGEIGGCAPYLGSKTEEKVKSYGKLLSQESTPLLSKIISLMSLIGWGCEVDSRMSNLLKEILGSLTDLEPDLLIPLREQITGSVEHRFHDSVSKHGGSLGIIYNALTHYYISTNTLYEYRKGQGNVNLHFQAAITMALTWISTNFHFGGPLATPYHIHLDCGECITPIYEGKLDFPQEEPIPKITSEPDNPFCWLPKSDVIKPSKLILDQIKLTQFSRIPKENWESSFNLLLAKNLHQIISLGMRSPNLLGSNPSVPYLWLVKCRAEPLIVFLALLYCQHACHNHQEGLRLLDNMNLLLTPLLKAGGETFGCLVPILASAANMNRLSLDPFLYDGGNSPEFRVSSCGHALRIVLVNTIVKLINGELAGTVNRHLGKVSYPITGKAIDHPCWLRMVAMYTEGTIVTRAGLAAIWQGARESLMWKEVEITDTTKLTSWLRFILLKRGRSDLLPISQQLQTSLSPAVVKYSDFSLDYLSKLINPPDDDGGVVNDPQRIDPGKQIFSKACVRRKVSRNDWTNVSPQIPDPSPDVIQTESTENHGEAHYLKIYGYPTTAPYKLLSLLPSLPKRPPRSMVACLADGTGGFSLTMLRSYPDISVLYNTLLNVGDASPQLLGESVPPALVPYKGLYPRVWQLRSSLEWCTDLTNPLTSFRLGTLLEDRILWGVTCDAEGLTARKDDKSLKILRSCMTLCVRKHAEFLLFKSYASMPALLNMQISKMLTVYSTVEILRSKFSGRRNTEVYLLGKTPDTKMSESAFLLEFDGSTKWVSEPKLQGVLGSIFGDIRAMSLPSQLVCDAFNQAIATPWMRKRVNAEVWYRYMNLQNSRSKVFPVAVTRYVGARWNFAQITDQWQKMARHSINTAALVEIFVTIASLYLSYCESLEELSDEIVKLKYRYMHVWKRRRGQGCFVLFHQNRGPWTDVTTIEIQRILNVQVSNRLYRTVSLCKEFLTPSLTDGRCLNDPYLVLSSRSRECRDETIRQLSREMPEEKRRTWLMNRFLSTSDLSRNRDFNMVILRD
nr:MAG: RNA-dependent RNA polymerase [Guiyang nephotettix cincticeps rhabdovirus 1]